MTTRASAKEYCRIIEGLLGRGRCELQGNTRPWLEEWVLHGGPTRTLHIQGSINERDVAALGTAFTELGHVLAAERRKLVAARSRGNLDEELAEFPAGSALSWRKPTATTGT